MIRIPCRCRHALELPDDKAGLSVQCPACGLLVDVPRLGDLPNIDADGTEIDLRGPVEPIPLADPEPDPEPISSVKLKYDPETGELIEALDLHEPEQPAPAPAEAIPVAKQVIDYSLTRESLDNTPHGHGVFASLFLPVNLVVMFIMLVAHVLLPVAAVVAYFLPLVFFAPILLAMFIAGTYAIALEELGPGEHDELPRPLRNVNLYEDFFAPAVRCALSLLLCYWPAIVILTANHRAAAHGDDLPFPVAGPWLLGFYLAGSVLLPAVFLTVCTSGTILNLRPDRILKLIGTFSWRYPLLCIEWLIASASYLLGMISLSIMVLGGGSMIAAPYVAIPSLMCGIYFAYAFCWHLGLHYRHHWREYPWILQQHERRSVAIRQPRLHPKLAAADQKAAQRARVRQQVR